MNNVIRYPFRDALEQHEAQFDDTDEGELVAGLAHLDEIAEPAGEPMQPIKTESITRLEICMVLGVIGIVSLSILASLLS